MAAAAQAQRVLRTQKDHRMKPDKINTKILAQILVALLGINARGNAKHYRERLDADPSYLRRVWRTEARTLYKIATRK